MIESPVLPAAAPPFSHDAVVPSSPAEAPGSEGAGDAVSHVWPGWPNLFSLLMAVILMANYFSIMTDLDWSWQIRTGQLIVETGNLRPPEAFSYTINGTRVHDFEWLYEVILYYVWTFLGMGGLKFLKMVFAIAPLLLLGWRLRSQGVRWHAIAVSLYLAVWIISSVWNLRALYCTTIGLLVVSGWLHDHCTGRKPLTWWLPVVMLLWSNLHPGVITGQGLLLGAIGLEWINRWLKFNPPLSYQQLQRLTLIAGVALLATFVSPDPIDRLLYPFRPELKHAIQDRFTEMRPLFTFTHQMLLLVEAVCVLAIMTLVTLVARARQYRLWEFCLLAGLALLGNLAVRCLMDWTLIMLALAVPKMGSLLLDAARTSRRERIIRYCLKGDRYCRRLMDSWAFRFQPVWLLLMVSVFLVISLIPPLANRLPVQLSSDWPLAPLEFAAAKGYQGNFFATPYHGAWIGWRLKENGRVYTDTRGFFFPPKLLEDSMYVPEMLDTPDHSWRDRLADVLAKKGPQATDYFLLHANVQLWKDYLKSKVAHPLYSDEQPTGPDGNREGWILLSSDQVREALRE